MEKKNTCFVCEYGWIIVGKFKSLSFMDLETELEQRPGNWRDRKSRIQRRIPSGSDR